MHDRISVILTIQRGSSALDFPRVLGNASHTPIMVENARAVRPSLFPLLVSPPGVRIVVRIRIDGVGGLTWNAIQFLYFE